MLNYIATLSKGPKDLGQGFRMKEGKTFPQSGRHLCAPGISMVDYGPCIRELRLAPPHFALRITYHSSSISAQEGLPLVLEDSQPQLQTLVPGSR